jgi:uncharacterized protein YbjQ (UPF0145 family)
VAPGVVVEAGASSEPDSSGMPSGPSPPAGVAVDVALVVEAPGAPGAAVLDAAAPELRLLLAPPQAATATALTSTITVQRRAAGMAAANGSGRRTVVSCPPMSQSAPLTDMPMTTAQELPGVRIRENLGVCYGLVVRSMGAIGGMAAGFKALRRGEVSQYTQLLEDSRRHAVERMVDNARLLGADGVVAFRFDSSEIGQQLTEIVAYGTAVKTEPIQ